LHFIIAYENTMLYNRGIQAVLAKGHSHYCQQRSLIESSGLVAG